MSLEAVTARVARVMSEVNGIRVAYAADPQSEPGVEQLGADFTDVPAASVTYDHLELEPGSFERLKHYLTADIWVRGRSAAEGEAEYLTLTSRTIAQFRTRVGLFGLTGITMAQVVRGGPARLEKIVEQPFVVFPLTIYVLEAGPQTYTL